MNNYFVSDILHYCNVSLHSSEVIYQNTIDFYDFTFVLSGSMTYTADGNTYVLKKNDAIFLKPGTVRSRLATPEPVRFVSFNFNLLPGRELTFAEYLPNCISANIKNLVSVFPQSHISPYFHSKEKIANMLNYILFEIMDATEFKSGNEHIRKILAYIDEHTGEHISLADVSQFVNLSPEYTSLLFKKEMKITLTEYINDKKLSLAKELILGREMSLSDVASYVGFENYNYFSRIFKRHFGVSAQNMKNFR